MNNNYNKYAQSTSETPWCIRDVLLLIVMICSLFMLSACGETVEFTEEVQLPSSNKVVLVKRKEIFEARINQLAVEKIGAGSELRIAGENVPAWQSKLRPMFLDALNDHEYLLVARIPNCVVYFDLQQPKRFYVAYKSGPGGWSEVTVPVGLDGKEANLLFGLSRPTGKPRVVTLKEKEQHNRLANPHPMYKQILLSSEFRC